MSDTTMLTLSEARQQYAPNADPETFRSAMFRVMGDVSVWSTNGPQYPADVLADRVEGLLKELEVGDD